MLTKTKSTKSKNNPRINLNLWLEKHKELKKIGETRAENYFLKNMIKNMRFWSVIIIFLGIFLGYLISKI